MVKVVPCELFVGGGVVPLPAEPVATACAGPLLVAALHNQLVCAFAADGAPRHCFRTLDPCAGLAYSPAADALLTRERLPSGRGVVRAYTAWRKGSLAAPAPAASPRVRPSRPGSPAPAAGAAADDPHVFVSAFPSDDDARCLGCCPRTGHVVVGGARRVTVFDARGRVRFTVVPRRPPLLVAVCGDFVGFAAAAEAVVLRVRLTAAAAAASTAAPLPVTPPPPPDDDIPPLVCQFDAAGRPVGLLTAMTLDPPPPGHVAPPRIGPIACAPSLPLLAWLVTR